MLWSVFLFIEWEMFEKFLKIYSTSIWSSFNEIFTGSKTLNFCFHLINTLISLTQLYFEHIFYFQLILLKKTVEKFNSKFYWKNRWKIQFQIKNCKLRNVTVIWWICEWNDLWCVSPHRKLNDEWAKQIWTSQIADLQNQMFCARPGEDETSSMCWVIQ